MANSLKGNTQIALIVCVLAIAGIWLIWQNRLANFSQPLILYDPPSSSGLHKLPPTAQSTQTLAPTSTLPLPSATVNAPDQASVDVKSLNATSTLDFQNISKWQSYKNLNYNFEFSYPSIYSQEEIKKQDNPNDGSILIAKFSNDQGSTLYAYVNETDLEGYKIIDKIAGESWCYDGVQKIWSDCATKKAGQNGPKKIVGPVLAYIYESGEGLYGYSNIMIPYPYSPRVIILSITNTARYDEITGKYYPPKYALIPEKIFSTFKFVQ